jgi:hypothetical protein
VEEIVVGPARLFFESSRMSPMVEYYRGNLFVNTPDF